MIASCRQCPRNCGVCRTGTAGNGFCHMGELPVVARAALHFWEEPCISGTRGSGTVFFSGCSLQCVFCQNYEISTEQKVGKPVTETELSQIFDKLVAQGAHNINLVNPTHFAEPIARVLEQKKPPVPVVYNSSGYESLGTLKRLDGLIDIYLPDFKYADNVLAMRYSGVKDYRERACEAILEMAGQTGPVCFGADGLLKRGTIVRHLILPGHTHNSIAVLELLSDVLPKGALVSLMAQYVPCGRAEEYPEINRRITKREYQKVQEVLFSLELDGFIQERSSATKSFIPSFDLEGVL